MTFSSRALKLLDMKTLQYFLFSQVWLQLLASELRRLHQIKFIFRHRKSWLYCWRHHPYGFTKQFVRHSTCFKVYNLQAENCALVIWLFWRIGKLLRATTLEEVLSYCDKYETEGRVHPTIMFDRLLDQLLKSLRQNNP